MSGKLLILTFHQPGFLTGEDLRFKNEAIKSGLISGDAMDEMGQNNDGPKPFLQANHDALFPKKAGDGGLQIATFNNRELVSFNNLQRQTWDRAGYKIIRDPDGRHSPTIFETWLQKVFATPIEVLVLAGHHRDSQVWGSQVIESGDRHRYFNALLPSTDGAEADLQIKGYGPIGSGDVLNLRAGTFDVTRTLKNCKLLVVFGCNGATPGIKDWRDCIMKARGDNRGPVILGFYLTHLFPRDAGGQFVSEKLWPKLVDLAPGNPGSKNLDFLMDKNAFPDIRTKWFDALDEAFPTGSPRRHLLFSKRAANGERGPRGAGAIDTDGKIFHIKSEAKDFEDAGSAA